MNEVITIYKPKGVTLSVLIQDFRKKFPIYKETTISPAGRLDPMAEGLVLLLIGDANKKRADFLKLDKTYEFTMLLGIQTDTYDLLGKITAVNFSYGDKEFESDFKQILPSYIGEFTQAYPPYSSKTVAGKPLFYWARHKLLNTITLPTKKVRVSDLSFVSFTKKKKETLTQEIIQQIKIVHGDFRQKEITDDWLTFSQDFPSELIVAQCIATVSSGTYIRSLCHEIGKELGFGAIAYSIKRTRIGDYSLTDAVDLNEL